MSNIEEYLLYEIGIDVQLYEIMVYEGARLGISLEELFELMWEAYLKENPR